MCEHTYLIEVSRAHHLLSCTWNSEEGEPSVPSVFLWSLRGFSELESSVRVALSEHLALNFKWDDIAALCAELLVGCSSLYMPYLCPLPEGLMEVPQESQTSVWMSGRGCRAMPWSVPPGPQGRPGKVGAHLGHP